VQQIDGNGDGLIDETEFMECLKKISQMMVKQEIMKKHSADKDLFEEE